MKTPILTETMGLLLVVVVESSGAFSNIVVINLIYGDLMVKAFKTRSEDAWVKLKKLPD